MNRNLRTVNLYLGLESILLEQLQCLFDRPMHAKVGFDWDQLFHMGIRSERRDKCPMLAFRHNGYVFCLSLIVSMDITLTQN
jgi:hypothetical protein